MTQQVAIDPWAVELYGNKDQPNEYKFIKPTLADHLFVAVPSPGARRITVKATDRFGNVYTDAILLWSEQVLIDSRFGQPQGSSI